LIDPNQQSLPVHPTQLYEMAFAVVVLIVLVKCQRFLHRDGELFALVFILYPAGRFLIEIVRADDRGVIGPFSTPQLVYLTAFVLATLFFARRSSVEGDRARRPLRHVERGRSCRATREARA